MKLFDWNILADGLDVSGGFVIPSGTPIDYKNRIATIIATIVNEDPDIITLQEVNHFNQILDALNIFHSEKVYNGVFCEKKDSPCLKMDKPPDGVCIIWKNTLDCLSISKYHYDNSTQCFIVGDFLEKSTNQHFRIATTHLKAKSGFEKKRFKQIKQLLQHFQNNKNDKIAEFVTGDLNSEPSEKLHSLFIQNGFIRTNKEPMVTTWKTRESTVKRQIDYIYFRNFQGSIQQKPTDCKNIPETGLPSKEIPSDHLPLICTFNA